MAAYYEFANHFNSKLILTTLFVYIARIQIFREMDKTKKNRKNLFPGTLEKFYKFLKTKVEFSIFRSNIFNVRNFDKIFGNLVVVLPF